MGHNILESILDGSMEPRDLPFSLLKKITENFSEDRILGRGRFSVVYKGVLQNCDVVVKRIMNSMIIDENLFYREVYSLLQLNHENIVRILGFCYHKAHKCVEQEGQHILAKIRERLLCFEYISRGSLENYITDELGGLEWNTRYNIIKGICKGLEYLHVERRILHLDLKPANILLDNDMMAKIDVGLSRMGSQPTIKNSFISSVYCAPEYRLNGKISVRSDVYSLGVIIIELVTGHRDISDKDTVLRRWRHRWNKSGQETPFRYQVAKLIEIGLLCKENDPYMRPSISEIICALNGLESTNRQISNPDEYTIGQTDTHTQRGVMEGVPMVCYSTGTINSLLDKLTNMMKNHSNQAEEFFKLTESLKGDLERLKRDFLDKFTGRRETHRQITVWMKQVRDLVFDIEDWIDLQPETNMVDLTDKEVIEYFKTEIEEARERCARYNLLEKVPFEPDLVVAAPSGMIIDPPLPAEEKPFHGVLDGPITDLVKHLTEGQEKRLKVVSVVGMEGLGKTTLAKEIYTKLQLQGQFDCQAFVSLGRRPAMREILNDMLCQLKLAEFSISNDVEGIITELREYISTKRYFIVVDGIWSAWAWKVINCVLREKNCGSRVLTTTCFIDVGKYCSTHPNDVVYQMEALSDINSRILFLSRITRQEERRADYEEVCHNMLLNISGGIPLAITVAADLFARKSEEPAELRMLGKSILSILKQYSTSEGMTKILHMSYDDLSVPLRSCFMSLSVFADYCVIKKDRLIRLWLVEGFIAPRAEEIKHKGIKHIESSWERGEGIRDIEHSWGTWEGRRDIEISWETGERYFNELISRRLIQPVFDYDDDQAVGCTIHGVILDFIRSLSREENFATRSAELSSGPFPCDTIRRFSLDSSNKDEAGSMAASTVHLSSMRSLTVFGDVKGMFDRSFPLVYKKDGDMDFSQDATVTMSISSFKLLRVLDLEDTNNLSNHHLEGIGGLVLLRYLGLRGTSITRLPEEISELEQLETLDVRGNMHLHWIPIHRFPKLVRLLGDHIHVQTDEFNRTPELPELEEVSILRSSTLQTVIELLCKSKQLRVLGVALSWFADNPTYFLEEVVKSNLQSLYIDCKENALEQVRLLLDSWKMVTAPRDVTFKPRRFELILSFRELPPNMAFLLSLTHLRILLYKVRTEDFSILGGLPNLAHLDLSVSKISSSSTGRLIIEQGAFPCLKVLLLKWKYGDGLEFQQGSAPQLRRLRLKFYACEFLCRDGHMVFPVKHFTCLTRVSAIIECFGATVSEVDATVARLRAELSRNPDKRHTLELSLATTTTPDKKR